ncbi:MAG: hypothetical protein E7187_05725 [Erysipelotrichaceae bacterium]|nr:hypothetical protein [Erysipelotrichaceae bacterium]
MKKLSRILLILLLTVISIARVNTVMADDVSGSASVYASASSVQVGNNVTVTVSISCSGGSIAKIRLNYNSDYLQFQSSNGDFNGGTFLIDTNTGSSGSQSFTFKTIASGSTNVSISIIEWESYRYSRVNYNSSASTGISIYTPSVTPTPSPSPGGGGGGGGGGGYTPTPVRPVLSSDASLAEIKLENLEFEPKFSSNVTDYTIYLPRGTEILDVTAKASSGKATVGDIDKTLHEGWNEVKITCTAEDKTTKTYTIKAYVEETPTVFYDLKERKLGVVKNLDKVTNEKFEKVEQEINGETITVFTGEYFKLLYLENENEEKDYYLYDDKENKIIGLYKPFVFDGKNYLINDVDYLEFAYMDDLYDQQKVKINDEEVNGWAFRETNLTDFKLVYLTDEKGGSQLYKMDTKEQTLQRYVIPEQPEPSLLPYIYLSGCVAGLVTLVFALALMAKKED